MPLWRGGAAEGDRTYDLIPAKDALYRLSYGSDSHWRPPSPHRGPTPSARQGDDDDRQIFCHVEQDEVGSSRNDGSWCLRLTAIPTRSRCDHLGRRAAGARQRGDLHRHGDGQGAHEPDGRRCRVPQARSPDGLHDDARASSRPGLGDARCASYSSWRVRTENPWRRNALLSSLGFMSGMLAAAMPPPKAVCWSPRFGKRLCNASWKASAP